MCEYCGCQAVAAIDELTPDHDLVVNLIGEVRAARSTADVVRMAAVWEAIDAVRARVGHICARPGLM